MTRRADDAGRVAGLDAGLSWLVFGAISVVGAALAMVFFRWE